MSLSIFLALCRHLPDINDAHIYARYGSSTVDTSVSFARLQQDKQTVAGEDASLGILLALCLHLTLPISLMLIFMHVMVMRRLMPFSRCTLNIRLQPPAG